MFWCKIVQDHPTHRGLFSPDQQPMLWFNFLNPSVEECLVCTYSETPPFPQLRELSSGFLHLTSIAESLMLSISSGCLQTSDFIVCTPIAAIVLSTLQCSGIIKAVPARGRQTHASVNDALITDGITQCLTDETRASKTCCNVWTIEYKAQCPVRRGQDNTARGGLGTAGHTKPTSQNL